MKIAAVRKRFERRERFRDFAVSATRFEAFPSLSHERALNIRRIWKLPSTKNPLGIDHGIRCSRLEYSPPRY